MEPSQTHFRSISLPSRLHPVGEKNCIQKLKSLQVSGDLAKALPVTSEGIKSGLAGLDELYSTVQKLTVRSPCLNQADQDHHRHHESSMEELLSDSVDLLDACNTIRELFQAVRENVRSLQSALRRKGLDLQQDIAAYFCNRKKMSKSAAKTLKSLRNLEHRINNADRGGFDFSSCRELTGITITVFVTILGFLISSNNNPGGWSLISRLVSARSSADYYTSGVAINEIRGVDFAVKCLNGKVAKRNGGGRVHVEEQVRRVQASLQEVDDVIQGVEGPLERVSRQLVQTRVNLLNVLTDQYL